MSEGPLCKSGVRVFVFNLVHWFSSSNPDDFQVVTLDSVCSQEARMHRFLIRVSKP